MLKTSKTAGTMYILFALSYKNALRITFDLFVVGKNTEKSPFCSVQSQIYIYRAEHMREIFFLLRKYK